MRLGGGIVSMGCALLTWKCVMIANQLKGGNGEGG